MTDIKDVIVRERGSLSSSILCGCAVALKANPLDDQVIIDGHLSSDIEYMLKYDPTLLEQVQERVTNFAFSDQRVGSRHMSLLDMYHMMHDPEYDELQSHISDLKSK